MNFENFVNWFKNNILINVTVPIDITETNNSYIISRLTGIEENPEFVTFIGIKKIGNFVIIDAYLDKQQDQKLVSKLPGLLKNQMKTMFGSIRFEFIEDTADEKAKTIFNTSSEEVQQFFLDNKLVWELPLKSKKKSA